MEPCARRGVVSEGVDAAADGTSASSKAVVRLNAAQRQELELLYQHCARPCSDILQQLVKDRPLLSQLDLRILKAWFHSRRLKEKRDIKLSPLIHKNAELKAEHEALLIRNNQLKNQALLLNLGNRLLREQLELQLPSQQSASSFVLEQPELLKAGNSSDAEDGEHGTLCESGIHNLETSLSKVKLT